MKKICYMITSLTGTLVPISLAFAQSFRETFRSAIDVRPAYASDLVEILQNIAGFLIITGGILAGISIIVSGILYMAAGSEQTKVTAAKAWFKNGIIGALVLFAVGLILQTLLLIATDPFEFFT